MISQLINSFYKYAFKPKRREEVIFIDAGHGGLDSNGNYVTAPDKMFKHGNDWFFEGVWNRAYADVLFSKLTNVGFKPEIVSHAWKDTKLKSRVRLANLKYKLFGSRCFFLSLHHNATEGQNARGLAVFTSKGQTEADGVAQRFTDLFQSKFPRIKVLKQQAVDGDSDYEADFYVLKYTKMPSILFETLFFDKIEDVKIIQDPEFINAYTDLIVEIMIEWAENKIQ